MATTRCPVCRRSFETGASPALPFCSERCRIIDLKRWLGEEYSVPFEPLPDEEQGDSDPYAEE